MLTTRMRRRLTVLFGVALLQFGFAGCAEMDGPEPDLDEEVGGGDGAFAQPGFTCNEQNGEDEVAEWVRITGDRFAPIVADSLKEDKNVAYPTVELRRVGTVDGEFDAGETLATLQAANGEDTRLRWVDNKTLRIRIDGDLDLSQGIYDVIVTNPSGESVRKRHAFGTLDRPSVEKVVPDLSCIEQGERSYTIQGGPFMKRGDSVPSVNVGGESVEPEASDCREVHGAFGDIEICDELAVSLDAETNLEPGAKTVQVTNLDPAGCASRPKQDGVKLRLMAPPEIDSVSPVPVCSKQKTYEEFEVTGSGFVKLEKEGKTIRPTVTVGDHTVDVHSMPDEGCEEIDDTNNETAWRCQTAYVRIQSGALDDVAKRGTGDDWETLSSHDAGDAGGDTSSSDAGTDAGGDAGDDTGGSDAADDAGSDAGPTTNGPTADRELTNLPLTLTNPKPVGCTSAEADLPVVPPPMVHDVTPDPFCGIEQDNDPTTADVTVRGFGFLKIDETMPTVSIGDADYDAKSASGCTDIEVAGKTVESCTTVVAEVTEGDVETGVTDVTVTNPAPADCQSEGSAPVRLTPTPTVGGIEDVPVCTADGDRQVTITGSDFYIVDGERPTVSFDASQMDMDVDLTVEADGASGCTKAGIDGESDDTHRCTMLTATIAEDAIAPQNDGELGAYHVEVTNPGPTGCYSEDDVTLHTASSPSIERLEEDFACLDDGQRSFTVHSAEGNFLRIADGMTTDEPMVQAGDNFYPVDAMGDCEQSTKLSDVELCGSVEFTIPQKDLAVADHQVSVHQPDPALCAGDSSVDLTVEPSPTVSDVEKQPLCNEQIDNTVTITGEFLDVDGNLPTVQIGQETYQDANVTATTCESMADQDITSRQVTRCTELQVQTDRADSLQVGLEDVAVTNPKSSDPSTPGCTSKDDETLRMEGPPKLVRVQPEPICTADGAKKFAAVGKDFLAVDKAGESGVRMPSITMSSTGAGTTKTFTADRVSRCQARPVDGDDPQVKRCDRVHFTAMQGDLPTGDYDVVVDNPGPAQCQSTQSIEYTVVPKPQIDSLDPNLTCLEDGGQSFVLTSTTDGKFIEYDGTTPEVEIDGEFYNTTPVDSSCSSMPDTFRQVRECEQVTFQLPEDQLVTGTYDVVLHNPDAVGCETDAVDLYVKPEPRVTDVRPSPVCTEGNTYADVLIEGEHFYEVEGNLPEVEIGGNTQDIEEQRVEDCSQTPGDNTRECTQIYVDITSTGALSSTQITENQVIVTNPDPVDCTSDDPVYETDVPSPELDNATVQRSCPDSSKEQTLVVEGDYYLDIDGDTPDVTVSTTDEGTHTYTDAVLAGSCQTLTNVSQPTRKCDVLNVELTEHPSMEGGDHDVGILNPDTAQCEFPTQTVQVDEEPPVEPEIDSINPSPLCAAGGRLTINGSNFRQGVTVSAAGEEGSVESFSDTQLEVEWPQGLPDGDFRVTVTNPDGCSDTSSGTVSVLKGPLAIFLDPPVHYNEIQLTGKLYFTNGNAGDITKVQVRGPGGTIRDLNFNTIAGEDDELEVTLPDEDPANAGQPLPAGSYDVRLTEDISGVNCGQWVDDLLTVTDEKAIAVQDIDPKYGWEDSQTSVRITAKEQGDLASGEVQFQPTPRVYLNPTGSTAGTTAVEMKGVTFNSPTELNGIVPKGMPVGGYDIIVINPDGTVGILEDAFNITDDAPPVIDGVSPGTWSTPRTFSGTIEGENFRIDPANQTSPPPVTVECEQGPAPASLTITNHTGTLIEFDVDTDGMEKGDACEITVTNPDGTNGKFSPIATVNPAYNFISFEDGPDFNQARRWPAIDSGEPSRQQRFLYSIGGDDGTAIGGTRSSIEFAQIDRFGNPESWRFLRYDLPGDGRTLARSTRVRDFIYMPGGHDGTAATDTIIRSNVLDPTHTPEIDDLDFNFGEGTPDGGLEAGTYYYRVAAVHTSTNDHNPAGETLTSNVQPVQIPDLGQRFDVQLTVSWTTFSDVDEYRLYRSPNPNMKAGEEKLLATIPDGTTQYTDDGSVDTSSDDYLPVGSLGTWHEPDPSITLSTARVKHGVRSAIDPSDPDTAYIYAVGGEDAAGAELDSIEKIEILGDQNQKRSQSLSGVTTSARTMSSARTEIGTMLANSNNANNLANDDDKYLYAAGGEPLAGGTSDQIDFWKISGGTGDLGSTRATTAPLLRNRSGFTSTIANNTALAFGGHNGGPDENGDNSNPVLNDGDFDGWDSLGGIDMVPRHRHGKTSFVGFFYLGGGVNGNGTLDSMEYSVIGTTRR